MKRWHSVLGFVFLLCTGLLLACGPQAQVQVAVEGPLAEGTQLGGVVRWSGTDERELPAQSATTGTWREGRAYVLTMPAAAQYGAVTVRLRLRDDAGCVVAEGSGAVDVVAQRSYKVTVSLVRGAPCRPELRVERVGIGFGRVVSEPAGIDCELRLQAGGSCAAGFPKGTKVRLRATVASTGLDASVFAGWRGPCQGAGECEVTVAGPLTATARLKPKPLRSRDGWAFEDVPYAVGPPFVLRAVFGFAPDDVWMASDLLDQDGVMQMLHYNGAFWAAVPSGIKNSVITDLHGSASDNVWAVGYAGSVSRWDGQRWQGVALNTSVSDLRAAWVVGRDDVWLGGGSGVWHLSAGKVKQELGAAQAVEINGLFGVGGRVYAVGREGRTFVWDGAFSPIATPTTNALRRITGRSDRELWAVGDAGTVLAYRGGGQWVAEAVPTFREGDKDRVVNLTDVQLVGEEVWATGVADGTVAAVLLRRSKAGAWSAERLVGITGPSRQWASATSPVWVAAIGGSQRWDGQRWASRFTINDLVGTGEDNLWISGAELDADGNPAVGRVLWWDGDQWKTVLQVPGARAFNLWRSSSGELWAQTAPVPNPNNKVLVYVAQDPRDERGWQERHPDFGFTGYGGMYGAANGEVWIGGVGYTARWDGMKWNQSLMGDYCVGFFQGTGGPLWMATFGGPMQWDGANQRWIEDRSDPAFHTSPATHFFGCLAGATKDRIWMAGFERQNGEPRVATFGGTGWKIAVGPNQYAYSSCLGDGQGRLWIAGRGVFRIDGANATKLDTTVDQGVTTIRRSSADDLWIMSYGATGVLLHYRP